jgi:CDGSH-type Zn-finger protein
MSSEHDDARPTIKPRENGPLRVDGLRDLFDSRGDRIAIARRGKGNIALCRCGESHTKPFCDGTHKVIDFRAAIAGEPPDDDAASETGSPAVHVTAAGPYDVIGGIELLGTAWPGETVPGRYSLCRCGHSGNKPFCDGTHQQVGFDDPGLDTTATARDAAGSEAAAQEPADAGGSDAG